MIEELFIKNEDTIEVKIIYYNSLTKMNELRTLTKDFKDEII